MTSEVCHRSCREQGVKRGQSECRREVWYLAIRDVKEMYQQRLCEEKGRWTAAEKPMPEILRRLSGFMSLYDTHFRTKLL